MSAQERRVKNVAEYLEQVSIIKEHWRNSAFAFRGQENEGWCLESSAKRRLKNSINQDRVADWSFIEYHKNLLEKCKLKNYDKREGKSLFELELLADLQHHRTATCLIDFTRNALVALWFACEKTGSNDSDGKVFFVNTADEKAFLEIIPPDIANQSIENILRFKTRETNTDKDQVTKSRERRTSGPSQNKPNFWYWTPAHLNERITAQHSLFLFGLPSVSEQLPSEKIIIESKSKAQIRQELKEIHDIHEESLFPDFVGFAYTQRHNALYYIPDAEEYFRRGVEAHQRGDFDSAIKDYTEAIERNPDLVAPYNNRGNAYGAKGDHDRAIQDYNKAIELNPDGAAAYYNRGLAYGTKGDHDRAIQDYTKAIERNLDDAAAYNNRGLAYGAKDDHDRAIQDYNKAIERNPDDAAAYYNRGNAYGTKDDHDRAIQDYTKAIERNPDLVAVYNNRGNAYYQKGKVSSAIQDYTKAIERKPDDAVAYYNRGLIYGARGDYDQAIQDYDKAIDLAPDDDETYYKRGEAWLFLKEWDKARSDLTMAKNRGVDIAKLFSSAVENISDFEQKSDVQLPDDIKEMLTP